MSTAFSLPDSTPRDTTGDALLPPPTYGDPQKTTKENATKLRNFMASGVMYVHPYRIRQHSRWRKADLFDQNIQWIVKSYNADPTRTMHWAALEFKKNDHKWIPTPNYNKFSAPIENEAARLGKPEYKPYVRPEGEQPNLKTREGAKLAEQALRQALEDMRWDEDEDRGNLHMPLYGGWYLYSYFDYSYERTGTYPVDGALMCPSCEFKLASPVITTKDAAPILLNDPDALQRQVVPPTAPGASGSVQYAATHCLTCDSHTEDGMGPSDPSDLTSPQTFGPQTVPGPPKLVPFTPIDDELGRQDQFGRSFGEDLPIGDWRLRTYDPYNVFVANLGVGVRPAEINEFFLAHVETLDWVRNRFENGAQVKAERTDVLQQYHPICGERALYYGGAPGVTLFRQHVRVLEYHKKPWRDLERDETGKPIDDGNGNFKLAPLNRGRSIIMAGNVVLFDGDFMIESRTNPGTYIPRCHLDYAAFKMRSGGQELDGVSLSEGLFDAQENYNEIRSQIQDCRTAKGSPKWLITRGSNFEYKTGGRAGDQFIYDPDDLYPNLSPREVDNSLMNGEVYKELDEDDKYFQSHGHLNDVEGGQPPAGITAALALQYLGEQSSEHRRPRIRRIREMLVRCYTHGLILMQELCRPGDNRRLWFEDDAGKWRQRSWDGTMFQGQTKVKIDAEPDHDTALVKQQTLRDYLNLNPQLMQTNPRAARYVARELEVAEDLFEEQNLQEDDAAREFIDYFDTQFQTVPVVDGDLDDDEAHYEQHGQDFMSEKWRSLAEKALWDQAYPYFADWETIFNDGPPQVVNGPNGPQQVPSPGFDSTMRQTQGPMPALLELRILACWTYILQQRQYQPTAPDAAEALRQVMRFRAHQAAHKMRAEGKKAQAAGGQQVLAAPQSSQETAAGTVTASTGTDTAAPQPGA